MDYFRYGQWVKYRSGVPEGLFKITNDHGYNLIGVEGKSVERRLVVAASAEEINTHVLKQKNMQKLEHPETFENVWKPEHGMIVRGEFDTGWKDCIYLIKDGEYHVVRIVETGLLTEVFEVSPIRESKIISN